MDNERLREKYNPEGSDLRKLQYRMLDILIVFDKICAKHQLPYWLEGGTLIGAVRHGGFIPWDDDLDVQMLRRDLKKLLKVLPKELPSDMVIQTYKTDKYYLRHIPRIRDLNSKLTVSDKGDWKDYKYQGAFIDILPVDYTGFRFLLFRKVSFLLKWKRIYLWGILSDINPAIKYYPFLICFKMEQFVFWLYMKIGRLFQSSKVDFSIYGLDFYGLNMDANIIFPLKKMNFEGYLFYVPNKVDEFLRRYYGDYMQLPPEEKRKRVHSQEVMFLQ